MQFTPYPQLAARVASINARLEPFPRAKLMISTVLPHVQGSPILDQNTRRFLTWVTSIKATRTSLTPGQPEFHAALASTEARRYNEALYAAVLSHRLRKVVGDLFRAYFRFLETVCNVLEFEVTYLEMWNTEEERERQGVYTRFLPCGIARAEEQVAALKDKIEADISEAMEGIRSLSSAFDRYALPFRPPPLWTAVALLRGLGAIPRPPVPIPSETQPASTSTQPVNQHAPRTPGDTLTTGAVPSTGAGSLVSTIGNPTIDPRLLVVRNLDDSGDNSWLFDGSFP
ncbi:uncharacterized protein LOC62_07G009452 [Vanrija pseudolonga]|uniref:Uncharacterized protein n=1 Tax=Vanrija pseudolonga TaxID=143232 RepID=A0AAF1BUE6_9TREE|nr:hypothetical protein LOC62_07G009452 [Vanrija pseudolonga]